ncbi:glycosyltransferase family 4 protein [Microvirga sp. TS319]|uniref:glycosyltransferase family 4 protein n=1 Tax=Microvirga sp. TS319 TaxID=3241165 RepID=UPI00351A2FED
MVINNAAWVSGLRYRSSPPDSSSVTLGFLSNISEDKGILRAIDTLRELLRRNVDARLLVAGGLSDERAESIVQAAKAELGRHFQYLGPIGTKEKERLLETINYFLFPSTYAHETQSLVVPEALAAGVPVIAVDHRYVGEVVGLGGHLVAANDTYSLEAAKWILAGVGNVALEHSRRASARNQFCKLSEESRNDISKLVNALSGRNSDDVQIGFEAVGFDRTGG